MEVGARAAVVPSPVRTRRRLIGQLHIFADRSKSIVKSGLSKRALVQLSYAIGVAKPLSLFVETYDSECGELTADDITNIVRIEFDCRPGAIAKTLAFQHL